MQQLNNIKKTFIIAEIGVNHNGSYKLAKKMIKVLKELEVDAVKFQLFKSDLLVLPLTKKTKYQIKNTNRNETQQEMLKKLELTNNQLLKLFNFTKSLGLRFVASPFDFESIKFIKKLKLDVIKIPSGEIDNVPYLQQIGKLNKFIILSTGMSDLNEIKNAVKILNKFGTSKDKITILHCTTEYPAPYNDVNLNSIKLLREKMKMNIGFSDHTRGIEISLAAVAIGASVIEKHFTLSRRLDGPDHQTSLEPKEFKDLVNQIRNIEIAMGKKDKFLTPSEKKNINLVRKSIVAIKNINKGEKFTYKNISTKRPRNGIPSSRWDKIIGKNSKFNFKKNDFIKI